MITTLTHEDMDANFLFTSKQEPDMPKGKDPLDYLSPKESAVMDLVLVAIEAVIRDKRLKEDLCGMILITIEEWGKAKP